jgi:hypothetical protein
MYVDASSSFTSLPDNGRQNPIMVNGTLDAIQSISDEVRRLLAQPDLERSQVLSALSVSGSLLPWDAPG